MGVSGAVFRRSGGMELRQDRHDYILLTELLVQSYGAGFWKDRQIEYTIQGFILLSFTVTIRDRQGNIRSTCKEANV